MARWSLVVLLIVAGMVVATPAAGVAQQSGVAASIRRGTCDGIGGVIAPLDTAAVPAGESRGVAEALPVARSFTTVPMSLAALAASEHAIAVPFPVGEELAGCGEIGGSLTDTGALVIGIAPQGDVAISGIAYLSPNPDPAQTDVSLFVTGEELFLLTAAFFPPTVAAEDAARFAAALAARDDSRSVAGPFAGQLVQREGMRAPVGRRDHGGRLLGHRHLRQPDRADRDAVGHRVCVPSDPR